MAKARNRSHKLDQAKHKAVDYKTDLPEEFGPKKPRSTKEWRSLIEERIQDAMADGRFDHLPGHGKPFEKNQNPFSDSDQELANGILKNNGYSPEWVERDLVIRQELAAAREALTTAWHYYQPDPETEAGWRNAVARFETKLQTLNQKIRDYNLIVPILSKQRLLLHLDEELVRLKVEPPDDY